MNENAMLHLTENNGKIKKDENHGLPGTNMKRAAGLNYELYCI